ncbi:MAG: DNA replication/repair protein RecF [Armatimonadota bacterium]
MRVEYLTLTDFRNYAELELRPDPGMNILLGDNAQGKSALLEAIYVLATTKSHRTSRDSDMIRISRHFARLSARISRERRPDATLELVISRGERKTGRIDGTTHTKLGDLIGQLNAVIFSSLDIEMVRGEPSLRRRFMDLEICQVSPQYVYALGRYKRGLEQRNNLLKEIKLGTSTEDTLGVWDQQLSHYGATVMGKRMQFATFLADCAARVYRELTGGKEILSVSYKPSVAVAGGGEIGLGLLQALENRREVDVSRGTTTVGPHRDDLAISVDGLSVKDYASQGQQRSVALALKLAEMDLLARESGEPPVLLLDDVGAELDPERRARAIRLSAGRCQTFVTTTDLEELDQQTLDSAAVFRVTSGEVIPQ